jgi:hypothetical protein
MADDTALVARKPSWFPTTGTHGVEPSTGEYLSTAVPAVRPRPLLYFVWIVLITNGIE